MTVELHRCPNRRGKRTAMLEGTGRSLYPAIEFEDGGWYREQSGQTIREGRPMERGRRTRRRDGGATLSRRGAIAQLGERLDRTQEVAGSSPASSTARAGCAGSRSFRTLPASPAPLSARSASEPA